MNRFFIYFYELILLYMANIRKNTNNNDMQSHIDIAYKTLEDWLPRNYVFDVYKKLPKDKPISRGTLHNVRQKKTIRLDILNAMVEVALEHKNQIEKLKKLTLKSQTHDTISTNIE